MRDGEREYIVKVQVEEKVVAWRRIRNGETEDEAKHTQGESDGGGWKQLVRPA